MKKRILFLFLLLLLSSSQIVAQGFITYGSTTVSALSAEAPIGVYAFQGTEGDQVTLQGISITPGLNLTATIQSGAEILVVSESDPYAASADDVRADAILPATGTYLILISSSTSSAGDFILKLAGQAAADKTIITGLPADVPIDAGATTYYSYTGSPDDTAILDLASQSEELQFLAIVRNSTGQIQTTASGNSAIVTLVGEGPYEIAFSGIDDEMSGVVGVALADISPQPEATETPDTQPTAVPTDVEPLATEEIVPDNTGACFVSATGIVNIRSGPSTNDGVISQTTAGQAYAVTGTANGWYQIDVPGIGTGWVFGDLVTTTGDCSAIPTIGDTAPTDVPPPTTAPDQPSATPTSTYTATVVVNQEQPTATFTPSYTPTLQSTATYTPSYTPTTEVAPQLAPEDARFNNPLNIALDSTASVLDFVSYPNGDTEDRVRWDITGMNQNSSISGGKARLVISASCFGDGTENIQFFTGGQTYTCGQTIVDQEVTFNSKTGSLIITAVGGTNTYVQWVLTGTATRVN